MLPRQIRDRLGSVRGNGSAANKPYGENYSAGNADGFATYYQDSSTQLNYADQRYYAATYGRFMSADPYWASDNGANDPNTPQTWNRYAYVLGNPVGAIDPRGLYLSAEECINDPDACEDESWDDGGQSSPSSSPRQPKRRKPRPIDAVTDRIVRADLTARLGSFASFQLQ